MRAQHQRFRFFRPEILHDLRPEKPCGAQLRNLHKEIHADAEEERESGREVVDTPLLQQAVVSGSVLRPGETVRAIKAAFRAEKAGSLVRLAKDVGRVGEKAGTRGALDTLRIAEGPKDVARAARLAESRRGQTRAILKLLGRGALLLAAGAFNLTMWVFGALFALFGFLSSIKATTERATLAWLRRKKARRLRKQLAAAPAPSG